MGGIVVQQFEVGVNLSEGGKLLVSGAVSDVFSDTLEAEDKVKEFLAVVWVIGGLSSKSEVVSENWSNVVEFIGVVGSFPENVGEGEAIRMVGEVGVAESLSRGISVVPEN